MQCPLCDPDKPQPNITDFDRSPTHLIITISKEGHTHVHGPFDDEIAIRTMARALVAEAEKRGITFHAIFSREEATPNESEGT